MDDGQMAAYERITSFVPILETASAERAESVLYGGLTCWLADGLNMQVLGAIADMERRRVLMLNRNLGDTTKLNAVQAFMRVEEKAGREVELRTV